jgi:hypothetical protein
MIYPVLSGLQLSLHVLTTFAVNYAPIPPTSFVEGQTRTGKLLLTRLGINYAVSLLTLQYCYSIQQYSSIH